MKLFKKLKLNSKGFSHVELLIVVVLVLAMGGVGYLVYREDHTSSTAHAGSWLSVGTIKSDVTGDKTAINVFACKQKYTSTNWGILGMGVQSIPPVAPTNDGIEMIDQALPKATANDRWGTGMPFPVYNPSGNDNSVIVRNNEPTDPQQSNYITFDLTESTRNPSTGISSTTIVGHLGTYTQVKNLTNCP